MKTQSEKFNSIKIGTFKHSGTLGDIIAALPSIRQAVRRQSKKIGEPASAVLYLVNGMEYISPNGAPHPTKNEHGDPVMLNEKTIEMIRPLLMAQEYISDVIEVSPLDLPTVHYDLDSIRRTNVAMGRLPIQRWYFYVFPQLTCELSEPWITVPDAEKDFAKAKLIVNRTERYQNDIIKYDFLQKYADRVKFFGTMKEYNLFTMQHNLNIEKLPVKNFLELAQAIKQSAGVLCNQSFCWHVAESMAHPRILEACEYVPDVTPFTPNGKDFLAQMAVEMYVEELMK